MRQTLPIHRFFTTILFLTVTTLTWAYNFAVDGIYYDKNTDGTSVTVTYKTSSDRGYSGSVVIPSTVTYDGKTYSVTSIGSSAFENCSGLTSVTIPNSITNIGDYAFFDCSGLTSITIPGSVNTIGNSAFYNCSGLTKAEFASIESLCKIKFSTSFSNPLYYAKHLYINGQEVTDVVIPESITSIDCAFSGCTGLTSVTIPESVTSIGDNAFSGCTGLTSVTIPNSVTNIGDYTFRNCTGLTSVTIPNSVTNIGDYTFYNCSGLTSVTIGNSVTNIGDYAFWGCSGLTSVTIPNSVTSIGSEAFEDCTGLTSVTIPESVTSIGSYAFNGTAWYNNQPDGLVYAGKVAYEYKGTMPSGTEIVLKEGTLVIAGSAFSNCSGLTSITIPESVTSIGDRAFSYCSGLTSVTIPKSVTSIGSGAFRSCGALEHVTIGNNVTGIEDETFENCYALSSITIGNSVTSIGKECFKNCRSLTSIIIPNSVTSIINGCFSGTSLTSIVVEKNNPKYDSRNDCNAIIETESNTLIAGCQNTIIPNSVTSIGRSAFSGCSSLTSVTVPESITSIGTGAFAGCTGLTKAEFASIESLCKIKFEISSSNPLCYAEHLYINGKEVTDVVIPNSITTIGDNTFWGCTGLTSVTIPNSVTNIGEDAFYGCTGLTEVACHAQNVPSTDSDVFYGVPQSTATLYVPKESIDAYKSASPWKDFGTILPITPTAVESLTADEASDTDKDTAIYDLNGRRLHEKPARGFYIQGGKKHYGK